MPLSELKKYPKVLVVGETFHKKTGTGITLSNLFMDWPKDKLAVLSGSNIWQSDVGFCHNYYVFKKTNKILTVYRNIFSIKVKNIEYEGVVTARDIDKYINIQYNTVSESEKKTIIHRCIKRLSTILKIKTFIRTILKFSGLTPLINQIEITSLMEKWIQMIKPDILYSAANTYEQIQFILELHKRLNIPYAIHIGDDHIKMMPPKGLLYFYWKHKMNSQFSFLIRKAIVRLSICEYMSQIYKNRYGFDFTPYLNPIEIDKWLSFAKKKWEINKTFKILYAGRYGFDNAKLLHQLAFIIDKLNVEGFNVQLDMMFGEFTDKVKIEAFKKYNNTKIEKYIPHDNIFSVIPTYDLLYLPLGFDKKTKKIYSVSLSTKIPEYMISGTPILVNAPEDTGYYQYAKQENWGYLLPTDNIQKLEEAIKELIENKEIRENLGKKAKAVAIKNHDAKQVRDNFRKEFIKAIES